MQAEIKGTTMPVLEMLLDPGDVIVTVHGDLSWMTPNVQMSQTTQTGGQVAAGGLWVRSSGWPAAGACSSPATSRQVARGWSPSRASFPDASSPSR